MSGPHPDRPDPDRPDADRPDADPTRPARQRPRSPPRPTAAPPTLPLRVDALVAGGVEALRDYARLTQDDVDYVVAKAAVAALDQHGQLAQAAVAETGRGLFEDKAVKSIFACEHVTHSMKGLRTVGVISHDDLTGITEIAEPVGVIAGVTPVTNPTSTTIFKSLLALKTRNPIIFGFHPAAQQCSAQAARVLRDAAIAAGARSTASSGSSSIGCTGSTRSPPTWSAASWRRPVASRPTATPSTPSRC